MKNEKHINEKDFRRYLADEMNNDERNEFERLLQKHPFEAEALEGMANFNIDDISSDIAELENKLSKKKKKTNFRYWAAAASILLIISSGIIIIQLNNKSPIPEIAENKIENQKEDDSLAEKNTPEPIQDKEELQITAIENEAIDIQNEFIPKQTDSSTFDDKHVEIDEIISKNELNDNSSEKSTNQIPNEKKARAESVKLQTPVSKQITEQNLFEGFDAPMAEIEISPTFENASSDFITGKVVSAYDGNLLSQVNISTKDSELITTTDLNGKFKFEKPDSNQTFIFSLAGMEKTVYNYPDDSENIIKMRPLNSNEPVAGRLSNMMHKKEIIENREAQPLGGYEEFNKYLEESLIIPKGYITKSKRVHLKIKIDSAGKITDIEASNFPDSLLFLKAKEIILARPVWLPEIKQGESVETEIKLKLKFNP